MVKKIGITGGSGLIGKILTRILKKRKIKFSCYKGDVRNFKDIKKWLNSNKDIKIVYHLAAIVPTIKVIKNKKKSINVNYKGTINLYKSIAELNKDIWFFFASTSHVYKPQTNLLKENDKLKPSSFYGKTKLMSENFLLKKKDKNIKICIGRIFSIFHKKQKKPYFYPMMISKYKNKSNIKNDYILKGGNSLRDFSNAETVAKIIFKLSQKKISGIINIGSGKKISLLDFVNKYINKNVKIKSTGKYNTIAANISKLKKFSIIK